MVGDLLQPTHLLFVLAVALLVLGPKRLPEVGRALGRGLRDFRRRGARADDPTGAVLDRPTAVARLGRHGTDRGSNSEGDAGACGVLRPHRLDDLEPAAVLRALGVDRSGYARSMLRAEDGAPPADAVALIALLRTARRPPSHYADLMEQGHAAGDLLQDEQGLLAQELAALAATDLARWSEQGLRLLTVLDAAYPENLRAVHDRPPFIFVRGTLTSADAKAVAVIGSRQASPAGIARAQAITNELVASGHAIVSGLALGVDAASHTTALELGARTLAVIGTGLNHSYPRENASLQERIASHGAVISQFWPDQLPRRENFPLRNALMSGLSLATVIVEAGHTSGARVQARRALGHCRPVLVHDSLLDQRWAQELTSRPGVHVVHSPSEVVEVVERVSSLQAPAG